MQSIYKTSAFCLWAYAFFTLAALVLIVLHYGFPPFRAGGSVYAAVYDTYSAPELNLMRVCELAGYSAGLVGCAGFTIYTARIKPVLGLLAGIASLTGLLAYGADSLIALSASEIAQSGPAFDETFLMLPRAETVLLLDAVASRFYYAGSIAFVFALLVFAIALFARGTLARSSAAAFFIAVAFLCLATILFGLGVNIVGELFLILHNLCLTFGFTTAAIILWRAGRAPGNFTLAPQ